MADIYFASLDIGTTGVKAIIVNQSGEILSKAYEEYPCEYPKPGWVEQNVDVVWEKLCSACREAIFKLNRPTNLIKTLGISSQRGTFIPVDKNIKPLMNSIVWSDTRADKELSWIFKNLGKERYQEISGVPFSGLWSYAKIKWFLDNKKDIFEKTFKILNGQEYFLNKLGAKDLSTDPSSITLNGMLDVNKLTWSTELCELIGLPMDKLPPMGTPARMVGEISKEASEKTGFAVGMPISIGGGDQQCAAIGAGITKEGMAELTVGTAMVMVAHTETKKVDKLGKVLIGGSGTPGKWNMEGLAFTAASALKWWRDNFSNSEIEAAQNMELDVYQLMDLEASLSPVGSKGLLFFPFFQGQITPNYDDRAKGGFLGFTFVHDRKDVIRSIMEGVSFEANMVKEAMESVLGSSFNTLRLSGGGSKSILWCHILADVFGRPVERLIEPDCTSLGAAILGAYGCGFYKSVNEAVEQMVHRKDSIEPNEKNHKLYKEEYLIFKNGFEALSKNNIYKEIADFQKKWF